MAVGHVHHGGLCDRLRSCTATYRYCMEHGLPFYIHHRVPFLLEDYLEPVDYDWRIADDAVSFDLRDTDILYTDTRGDRGPREMRFRRKVYDKFLHRSTRHQHHFYTSFCDQGEEFGETFRQLFRPVGRLRQLVDEELSRIGGEYISVATRFLELLGDFREPKPKRRLDEAGRRRLMSMCIAEIERIHNDNPEVKVLVTSDSALFVEEASNLPYVYTIGGEIKHVDAGTDAGDYTKTFVDFFMISKAKKVYQLCIGPMYDGYFSRSAAMAGAVPFERITSQTQNL